MELAEGAPSRVMRVSIRPSNPRHPSISGGVAGDGQRHPDPRKGDWSGLRCRERSRRTASETQHRARCPPTKPLPGALGSLVAACCLRFDSCLADPPATRISSATHTCHRVRWRRSAPVCGAVAGPGPQAGQRQQPSMRVAQALRAGSRSRQIQPSTPTTVATLSGADDAEAPFPHTRLATGQDSRPPRQGPSPPWATAHEPQKPGRLPTPAINWGTDSCGRRAGCRGPSSREPPGRPRPRGRALRFRGRWRFLEFLALPVSERRSAPLRAREPPLVVSARHAGPEANLQSAIPFRGREASCATSHGAKMATGRPRRSSIHGRGMAAALHTLGVWLQLYIHSECVCLSNGSCLRPCE